jgi:hypothetical protein
MVLTRARSGIRNKHWRSCSHVTPNVVKEETKIASGMV